MSENLLDAMELYSPNMAPADEVDPEETDDADKRLPSHLLEQDRNKMCELSWLWEHYIPYGKITLLVGDPGEGKSTFILNLIAAFTNGGELPDGTKAGKPINCTYLTYEDDQFDSWSVKLDKAGADFKHIYVIEKEITFEEPKLQKFIEENQIKLMVFDPIQSFLPGGGELGSAGRMRRILGRIKNIAGETGCAIVILGHMTKNGSYSNDMYRALGSIDIMALARSALMILPDNEDEDVRHIKVTKSSYGKKGMPVSFRFNDDGTLSWMGTIDKKELIRRTRQRGNIADGSESDSHRTVRDGCVDDLKRLLLEEPLTSNDVYTEMEQLGYKRRTVENAKADLHIRSFKKGSIWYWALPDDED